MTAKLVSPRLRSLGWTCLALVAGLFSNAAQAGYVLTEVSRPGADGTALWDINNLGQAVGYSVGGISTNAEGFIYQGGVFTALSGPSGSISSNALGISDTGVVVGTFSNSMVDDGSGNLVLGPSQGYIYSGGSYTTFNVTGALSTHLRGISSDGRYVAGYYATSSVPGVGFVYDLAGGVLTNLSLANSLFTIAQGVNNAGNVVGSDTLIGPPTARPGWIYDAATGTRSDVTIPGAPRTAVRTISDSNDIAGWYIDAAGDQHGFVGPLSGYQQIDFAGASQTYIEGANNAGWIVGGFSTGGTNPRAFIGTPVPEPTSVALVVLALGLAARGRPRTARQGTRRLS